MGGGSENVQKKYRSCMVFGMGGDWSNLGDWGIVFGSGDHGQTGAWGKFSSQPLSTGVPFSWRLSSKTSTRTQDPRTTKRAIGTQNAQRETGAATQAPVEPSAAAAGVSHIRSMCAGKIRYPGTSLCVCHLKKFHGLRQVSAFYVKETTITNTYVRKGPF